MPPNTKDLAINQLMVAYGNRQNAKAFVRANNSELLRSMKHFHKALQSHFRQEFSALQIHPKHQLCSSDLVSGVHKMTTKKAQRKVKPFQVYYLQDVVHKYKLAFTIYTRVDLFTSALSEDVFQFITASETTPVPCV